MFRGFQCILFFRWHLLFCFVNSFFLLLMLDFCTPYSFLKCCCIFSIWWFCPLLFTFKIFEKSWSVWKFLLSWNFFILSSYRFTLVAFAVILCSSSSITYVNPLLLSPYFWSCQSFSFSLYFFHLPANHASILIGSFLNLLISLRILLFQKGSLFSLHFICSCRLLLLRFSLLLVWHFCSVQSLWSLRVLTPYSLW